MAPSARSRMTKTWLKAMKWVAYQSRQGSWAKIQMDNVGWLADLMNEGQWGQGVFQAILLKKTSLITLSFLNLDISSPGILGDEEYPHCWTTSPPPREVVWEFSLLLDGVIWCGMPSQVVRREGWLGVGTLHPGIWMVNRVGTLGEDMLKSGIGICDRVRKRQVSSDIYIIATYRFIYWQRQLTELVRLLSVSCTKPFLWHGY